MYEAASRERSDDGAKRDKEREGANAPMNAIQGERRLVDPCENTRVYPGTTRVYPDPTRLSAAAGIPGYYPTRPLTVCFSGLCSRGSLRRGSESVR